MEDENFEIEYYEAQNIAEFLNECFDENLIQNVRATIDENEDGKIYLIISTSITMDGNQKMALFQLECAKALLNKLFISTTAINTTVEPKLNLILYVSLRELTGDLESLLEDLKFFYSFYLYKDRHESEDLIIDFTDRSKTTPPNMDDEVLRTDDVLKLLKIGRTSLYEFLKKADFPKPGRMPSIKGNFWLKSQVVAWAEKNLAFPSAAD